MSSKFRESEQKWKMSGMKSSSRDYSHKSASGEDVELLYYPDEGNDEYINKLNFPGEYPYTRGIHPNLYRGKLWTMR